MAQTEQKITKIVDGITPTIEATVEQVGSQGALVTKDSGIDSVIYENSQLKTTLFDINGNEIEAHIDTDGESYLGTAIIQAIHTDPNNSSTTNLTSANSYTFTGAVTSTLGVAGLQWNLRTDQNATIYIDQSSNGTNWDITDTQDYYYSKGGMGETIQALAAYWRIRVVLKGTVDTTYFRLQAVLCPTVESLPRALNNYGRLITSGGIVDEETGVRVDVDTLGTLRTMQPARLVGTSFSGTTKDTNFWTEAVTGTGSVTQAGEITLATGTTANSTVAYYSVRKARKVTGATNQFRTVAKLGTATQANNLRRLGCYDSQDGFFFQVNGTTFGVGSRKGGSDTIVTSGSFNGNYGSSVVMDTAIKRLIIEYDHLGTKFFVNGILLHTITGSTAALTNTLNLGVYMENINSGGNDTNNTFVVRFACIQRLGLLQTDPTYKYISTNTTTICKYGAGELTRIVNVDNAGSVTIYDNTSATGTIIATIDTAKALGDLTFGVPFSNGLTIVTATGAKIVVVYE